MTTRRYTIRGEAELKRKLASLENKIAGEALKDALVVGAFNVVNMAKERCRYKTGNLRRSIHIGGEGAKGGLGEDPGGSGSGTTGTDIGGQKVTPTSATILVGTNVDYAKVHEYGSGNISAQPYMRPALDETNEDVVRDTGKALEKLIENAVR